MQTIHSSLINSPAVQCMLAEQGSMHPPFSPDKCRADAPAYFLNMFIWIEIKASPQSCDHYPAKS